MSSEIYEVEKQLMREAVDMRWEKPRGIHDSRTDRYAKMNHDVQVNILKDQGYYIVLGKDNSQDVHYDRYLVWARRKDILSLNV